MKKLIQKKIVLFFLALLITAPSLAAGEPHCEVVQVAGQEAQYKSAGKSNPLKQGDRLRKGDVIVIGKASSVDIAFDPEWQNVSHLGENTTALVRWISPTRVELRSGDIYSKLDNLKGSSFEVATPIAIAVVRGTKYRVTHSNGVTTVFNDSETSLVYVYRLDENGNRAGRAIVLKPGESTTITGEVEVYESMLEELQDARDREDQDQLNDDLNRSRSELVPEEPVLEEGQY